MLPVIAFIVGIISFAIYAEITGWKEGKARRARLTSLVEAGRITRAEADEILAGKPAAATEGSP